LDEEREKGLFKRVEEERIEGDSSLGVLGGLGKDLNRQDAKDAKKCRDMKNPLSSSPPPS
jgi:hypothetical protein